MNFSHAALKRLLLAVLTLANSLSFASTEVDLIGAWHAKADDGTMSVWIVAAKHFSIAHYKQNEFVSIEGGEWSLTNSGEIELRWEYHTSNKELIGSSKTMALTQKGDKLSIAEREWSRIDNGSPGKLSGAWLFTGRYRDGQLEERTPGVRRTMKILSGTKFQWIAYNIETKEFFGAGGGTYTTVDGKYTEHIEFFSRDNSRVGSSLEFEFRLEDGKWRHSGKSSKGDPLDEVWTRRDILGI